MLSGVIALTHTQALVINYKNDACRVKPGRRAKKQKRISQSANFLSDASWLRATTYYAIERVYATAIPSAVPLSDCNTRVLYQNG